MRQAMAELERNIDAEIGVQTRIQELLDRQLDILLKGRTRELGNVLAEAEQGLVESGRLEAERGPLLQRIGAELHIPATEVTLSRIESAIGESAAPLIERGAELKACVARIRESNRHVALLLRHSVLFLEDLISIVSSGARRTTGDRTYTRAGALTRPAPGALAAEA
ncbi:MAG: hypothetical protein EXS13_07035 [Planctomycetes bacterium]|nr:hypothetical protein [Planctomycetota bacterium]